LGKKISMEDAIERLQAKGWKTKLDERYLSAYSDEGDAYQFVPASGNRIELNELRAVPECKPLKSKA
jgi:beta-lactam-binding protein with PASTA domain